MSSALYPRANEILIKHAIELLFKKKVVDVNTCRLYRQEKARTASADFGRKELSKKAIVTLRRRRRNRVSSSSIIALRNFRPLTPALRFKSLPMFQEVTKSQSKPVKSLTEPKKRSGGRNNNGRLTSRHIGGGHEQKYRKVDFKRRKHDIVAKVIGD